MRLAASILACALLAAPGAAAPPTVSVTIGTGATLSAWKAIPADGVSLVLASDNGGRALRLDFDFHGGGGYAVAHRAVSLDMPANYRFTFRLRGECLPNNLEFKLLDQTGENVWWRNQRNVEFAPLGRTMTLKKRNLSFAWGPLGGGEPKHIAGLEFAITAGQGGKGTVWIEDLKFEPLPPADSAGFVPVVTATSHGDSAAFAVDSSAVTAWTSARGDSSPTLTLDLRNEREFGGLVIDWAPGHAASGYAVEFANDTSSWHEGRLVYGGNGGRDWIALPESEGRWVRIRTIRAAAADSVVGIANVEVKPLAWSATLDDFFGAIAREASRGNYPRAMLGENVFWTVVGQDFDTAEGLVDETGRLETGKGAYSLEPFLRDRGRLLTWNDVTATPGLVDGDLPMPTVEWRAGDLAMNVTVFAVGAPGKSDLVARYRVRNLSSRPRRDTLYLALRPFQVNPPTQFLNAPGGVALLRSMSSDGNLVRVNGDRGIWSLNKPSGFGVATFDQGDIVEYLRAGRLPEATHKADSFAHASGALAYTLDLPANGEREVSLFVFLHTAPGILPLESQTGDPAAEVRRWQAQAERQWRERLDRVTIQLPDSDVVHALKAQLAWVLVNRAGPAIQPGARSYARSWIRDGCLTSSALLRLGETEAVRQFIEWFAPYQFENGKSPCCVDQRGADPVPEHDSSGELIHVIAEYVRFTGDSAFAEKMWPHVLAAAGYLDTLRAQRLTPEWSTPANAPFHGILPPSISHEGYSAKPMHSYWDDFFALRGFKDAAWLAALLARPERSSLERDRDEFARDLGASIVAAMKAKGIDYVPGCADLGDFDATSTSIALDPVEAGESVVSRAALERTYAKYWDNFSKRGSGADKWEAFTPYEWRNVGAMVRLGWRDRAQEALQWFMRYRRPPGFQHWAEVVWHDERAPHFIGDMPHTWVGTDYVRSVLDMLAYENEADSSLVIGAGVPAKWLEGDGVIVKGLRTRWGAIDFGLRRTGLDTDAVLAGPSFRMPAGGILVMLPGGPSAGMRVTALPATVRLH